MKKLILAFALIGSYQLFGFESTINKDRFFVKFKSMPTKTVLKSISSIRGVTNIGKFLKIDSSYFNRLYQVNISDEYRFKTVKLAITSLDSVESIELSESFDAGLTIVAGDSVSFTDDTFVPLQWGMKNANQTLLFDLDDINSLEVKGKKNIDIGISKIYSSLNSLMKEEVVVSVLDSGIYREHEDLKDGIYYNKTECYKNNDGDYYPMPEALTSDKDGNGYTGDCIGFSFSKLNRDKGFKNYRAGESSNVTDDLGHGTHVAGIISAVGGNGFGIAGAGGSRVKISTVKVLYNKAGGGSRKKNAILGTTDRFAKGLEYALATKAKVINMSLGWPKALHKEYLQEIINEVLKKNITIIAAAGNNSSIKPIFPCAIDGVICVGSIRNDGTLSSFSNYGGAIDLVAPGDQILSTYPRNLAIGTVAPTTFDIDGYEIKSGTSQSAPFVSAAAAILKGIYPKISGNELYARLVSTTSLTHNNSGEKYTLHGLLNIERAINKKATPVIVPQFKKSSNCIYSSSRKCTITVPIKNYWKRTSSETTIKIELFGVGLEKSSTVKKLSQIGNGETININVTAKITDSSADNRAEVRVTISNNKKTKIYRNAISIINKMDNKDRALTTIPFNLDSSPTSKNIYTVSDPYFRNQFPEYYSVEWNKDDLLSIQVYRNQDGKYGPIKNSLKAPTTYHYVNFRQYDFNYDSKLDYMLVGATEKYDFFIFTFFDNDGNYLWGTEKNSTWYFKPRSIVPERFDSLNLIPFFSEKLGKIGVPVFVQSGTIPSEQLDPNTLNDENNNKTDHIYYLAPTFDSETGKMMMKDYVFDDYIFKNSIQDKLLKKYNESVNILNLIPQTEQNQKSGKVSAIISAGKGLFSKYYLMDISLDGKYSLTDINTEYEHLIGYKLYPTIDLTNNIPSFNAGTSFVGYNNSYTLTHITLDKDHSKIDSSFTKKQQNMRDHFLYTTGTFTKDSTVSTFVVSKHGLMIHQIDKQTKKERNSNYPVYRFSFLPGHYLRELYYPISVIKNGVLKPALYVDATPINANNIHLITTNESGQLISPISKNIEIPKNCISMYPYPIGRDKKYHYSVYCKDGSTASLNFYSLEDY